MRHAGAIYAMMEANEELGMADRAAAGDRAVDYLVGRMTTTKEGTFFNGPADQEQRKVGGAGLALVALVEYQRATGHTRNAIVMRALAQFIVHQQYPDGHLRDNADVEEESEQGAGMKTETWYYVGEAILGLVRLYGVDAEPRWLAAARKTADWVIDVRDARADLSHQIPDHWLSYALHDLYVLTGERRYAEHALRIGRAIELRDPGWGARR